MRLIALAAIMAAVPAFAGDWRDVGVTDKTTCRGYFAYTVQMAEAVQNTVAFHERKTAEALDRERAAQIVKAYEEISRLYQEIAEAADHMCRAYD